MKFYSLRVHVQSTVASTNASTSTKWRWEKDIVEIRNKMACWSTPKTKMGCGLINIFYILSCVHIICTKQYRIAHTSVILGSHERGKIAIFSPFTRRLQLGFLCPCLLFFVLYSPPSNYTYKYNKPTRFVRRNEYYRCLLLYKKRLVRTFILRAK